MGKFGDDVNKFAKRFEKRFRAVARTAVQETTFIAQKPTGQGGRMRIDTGFLRASIQAALGSMPKGPTTNDGGYGGKRKYPIGAQAAGEPVAATLVKWDPIKGRPLYLGWTANYARVREYHDGFLRGAVQKWDSTVKRSARIVRESIR
jgi:hypothetical protein